VTRMRTASSKSFTIQPALPLVSSSCASNGLAWSPVRPRPFSMCTWKRALVDGVVARPAQAISDGLERRFAADDSVTSDKV
jgi:hypothetical protein